MKKYLTTLSMIALMGMSSAALAGPNDVRDAAARNKEGYERIKSMSPEERKAFFEEKRAKWEGMSKEEKLKTIEERRAKRMQEMDARWQKMSDDEKIAFVEKKMQGWRDGKGGKRGCKGSKGEGSGPHGHPGGPEGSAEH